MSPHLTLEAVASPVEVSSDPGYARGDPNVTPVTSIGVETCPRLHLSVELQGCPIEGHSGLEVFELDRGAPVKHPQPVRAPAQ
jgi:hypothetical protein